jgi:hypothetical protein
MLAFPDEGLRTAIPSQWSSACRVIQSDLRCKRLGGDAYAACARWNSESVIFLNLSENHVLQFFIVNLFMQCI